jgi:hypothetical protein
MSIQPDLQFSKKKGDIQQFGFQEVTPESIIMDQIKSISGLHIVLYIIKPFIGFY